MLPMLLISSASPSSILVIFSYQIFNLFPWVRALTSNKRLLDKLVFDNKTTNFHLFNRLKETLDPQQLRGFVDAFMVRKQNLEVGTLN